MSVKTYVVDLKVERERKNRNELSDFLVMKMHETLEKGEQCLLFLNKRGFSSALVCQQCGDVAHCKHCDIALTYHNIDREPKLVCHYCGYLQRVPNLCSACHQGELLPIGSGTQKIEQELKQRFAGKTIRRVDMDSMSKKGAYHQLLEDVHNGTIDILIGTQILAKGLDFPKVTLVGVINADVGLHIPDFRSYERTYQLLSQVQGRASRKGQDGVVVVQTNDPENKVIQFALQNDYDGFFAFESAVRKQHRYPPFVGMAKLSYSHPDESKASSVTKKVYDSLSHFTKQHRPDIEVFYSPSYIPKKYGKFHYHILLKGEQLSEFIQEHLTLSSGWKVDIDPVNTG